MTALELTSPSFAAMDEIPRRHTCEGDDVSPELHWSGVPDGARSAPESQNGCDFRPPGGAAWIDAEVAALREHWRAAIPRRLEVT